MMEQQTREKINWNNRKPETVSDFIYRFSPIFRGLALALMQSGAVGNFSPLRNFMSKHEQEINDLYFILGCIRA